MRRIVWFAPLVVIVTMLVLFSSPTNVVAQSNLLQNPGFEGQYSAWQIQYGTAQVAAGWTPWWFEDANHDPIYAQPEYKPAEGEYYPNRVFEGRRAQQWFTFYKSHYGGMYQQVSNVTPGQRYRFTLVAQVWSSSDNDPNVSVGAGDPRFEIGIDPTGAARPGWVTSVPSTIEWSGLASMASIIDKWGVMTVEAVAQSSTITVYIKANPQYAVQHNDIYIDAAQLFPVGDPPAPEPEPQPQPQPEVTQPVTPVVAGTTSESASTSRWTNIYDNPAGRTVGVLAPNTSINIVQRSAAGNWVQIISAQGNGWVPATAVTGGQSSGGGQASAPAPTGGVRTTRWTNVYQSPNGAPLNGVALAPNTSVEGISFDPSRRWAQIRGSFGTGWVPANAVTGGTGTPTASAQPAAPAPAPVATPAPAVSQPSASRGEFGFGAQTHSFANPDRMRDVGMGWVKFQHKWGEGNQPNDIQGRISDAHAKGFKVLMSIPGGDHSNINFDAYVNFLGGVARLSDPPDAIEIWNEMNIDREWPAGQISATTYVNSMLKPAYSAIKAGNPNVMVITGAPAPTGFFGGCSGAGCDDNLYMQEMASAGAAGSADCIGIHYNEGILPPSQRSGDPRGNGGHYTRYFWGMVDAYYNAFNGQLPLCFTELGYLSGDGFSRIPAGFAWAKDTSVDEHAQWLGEAVTLSRNSEKIKMLIIFNFDFDYYDPNGDPQAGFAMIRPGGGCPACDTVKAAMGR